MTVTSKLLFRFRRKMENASNNITRTLLPLYLRPQMFPTDHFGSLSLQSPLPFSLDHMACCGYYNTPKILSFILASLSNGLRWRRGRNCTRTLSFAGWSLLWPNCVLTTVIFVLALLAVFVIVTLPPLWNTFATRATLKLFIGALFISRCFWKIEKNNLKYRFEICIDTCRCIW